MSQESIEVQPGDALYPNPENTGIPPEQTVIIAKDVLPEILPIIPLYNRPMFPKMLGPIIIENETLIQSIIELHQKHGANFLGLILIKSSPESVNTLPTSATDLYSVGVAVKILQISPYQPNTPLQLLVQILERFELVEMLAEKPMFRAKVSYWHETVFETNEELKAYSVAIIDCIKELVKLNPLFKEGLSLILERINVHDPGSLADFSVSMTTATGEELQQILETRSIRLRIEKALVLLKREVEISNLKVQISKRIEDRLSKQQREFFLKQQLKEIKKELGLSKDDTETEVEKFKKRISQLVLGDEAKERIEEEIEKLRLLETSSPEFNVTRAYLDWLTILPWGVYTQDNYDILHAENILDEDHYGLKDVKDRILELISVGIIKGDLAGSIILLVGPPGVGKTSIGQSIARSLGRKFYRFSLGGMRDEAEIKGHRRTYIGALPGKFIQAIKTCKTSNPVIMLDEIDKIGASFQGDPASALLEVLDPEQNKSFLDHYIDVRFDLSKVLFICTANQTDSIPSPLLDRMETIKIAGYILEEKMEIAKQYLIPKQLNAHGITDKQIIFSNPVLKEMIEGYARESGVRSLENNIKKILRKSAKQIVQEKKTTITIRKNDLSEWLGRRVFSEEMIFKKPRVGVVMGLAYTSFGGTTLYVEATLVPSQSPGFKQTGQLGKVMIESSEIAYTYIRSLLRNHEQATNGFNRNLIHLHVPAGATPKDGPSAGVTMACAIYSLISEQPIIQNIAMTGELSLTGMVMPIGGVKEKLIAAKRAKVSRVILPLENEEEYKKLDSHIQEGMEVFFVRTFEDIRNICFPNQNKKNKSK
ncbi:MAG: endopeptidase La [Desulfobacterales bacterium]|nr:endopeptidase La [Desulfobacterales bacterium]